MPKTNTAFDAFAHGIVDLTVCTRSGAPEVDRSALDYDDTIDEVLRLHDRTVQGILGGKGGLGALVMQCCKRMHGRMAFDPQQLGPEIMRRIDAIGRKELEDHVDAVLAAHQPLLRAWTEDNPAPAAYFLARVLELNRGRHLREEVMAVIEKKRRAAQ